MPIPESGCWIWMGQVNIKNRYGQFRRFAKDKWNKAHRISYEAFHGQIDDGNGVLHKCDIPECVNPAHLYQGTQKDNCRDMIDRNRQNIIRKKHSHCMNGHPLTDENRLGSAKKECKICHKERQTGYRKGS